MKKWILFFIFVPFLLLLGLSLLQQNPENPENIDKSSEDILVSSAKISAGVRSGSAVLLSTGYVITAKHCVDLNDDELISLEERFVKLTFFQGSQKSVDARVLYFSKELDFVILEVEGLQRKGVNVLRSTELAGSPVIAAGCTRGYPTAMSFGYIAISEFKEGRATTSIYAGNSGGGLFDFKSHELVGLINCVAVKHYPVAFNMLIPFDGSMYKLRVDTSVGVEMNGLARYIRMADIRKDLSKVHLEYLIEPESITKLTIEFGYIWLYIQMLFIAKVIYDHRKHLLG